MRYLGCLLNANLPMHIEVLEQLQQQRAPTCGGPGAVWGSLLAGPGPALPSLRAFSAFLAASRLCCDDSSLLAPPLAGLSLDASWWVFSFPLGSCEALDAVLTTVWSPSPEFAAYSVTSKPVSGA